MTKSRNKIPQKYTKPSYVWVFGSNLRFRKPEKLPKGINYVLCPQSVADSFSRCLFVGKFVPRPSQRGKKILITGYQRHPIVPPLSLFDIILLRLMSLLSYLVGIKRILGWKKNCTHCLSFVHLCLVCMYQALRGSTMELRVCTEPRKVLAAVWEWKPTTS